MWIYCHFRHFHVVSSCNYFIYKVSFQWRPLTISFLFIVLSIQNIFTVSLYFSLALEMMIRRASIDVKVSRTVLESLVGHASITSTPQDTNLTLIKPNNIGRHWEYERIMPLKVWMCTRGPSLSREHTSCLVFSLVLFDRGSLHGLCPTIGKWIYMFRSVAEYLHGWNRFRKCK